MNVTTGPVGCQDFSNVERLQAIVASKPYSTVARLELAEEYEVRQYSDLAAGEFYLALLLVDEALGFSGEFEEEALAAAADDYDVVREAVAEDKLGDAHRFIEKVLKERILISLVRALTTCGNTRDAKNYLDQFPDLSRNEPSISALDPSNKSDGEDSEPGKVQSWSLVAREVYPWNHHEPDRASEASLTAVNELLREAAPKLEARITSLPDLTGNTNTKVHQIGLFAKEDIASAEKILDEKSVLTAAARLNDTFCDACAARLTGLPSSDTSRSVEGEAVTCPECMETVFCSAACLETAQELYHPAICDMGVSSIGKDAPAKEAADSLYLLLLQRVFALSTHQGIHPLDLVQTKFLWGDFLSRKPALPFNFQYNVVLPLQMLEKMDVNIFTQSHFFSTWVFNTLYAKFRGTADARQGPDGKPEIAAVHPLWCLANHSCDPNVRWEWEGSMKFWVRTEGQRVDWKPKQAPNAGLAKGEQVFGHYCDISLPVIERREWARGALGGDCMCDRCLWEAANPSCEEGERGAKRSSTLVSVIKPF